MNSDAVMWSKLVAQELLASGARHVRTPAGAKHFDQPIGAVIVPDTPSPRGTMEVKGANMTNHPWAKQIAALSDAKVAALKGLAEAVAERPSGTKISPADVSQRVYGHKKGAGAVAMAFTDPFITKRMIRTTAKPSVYKSDFPVVYTLQHSGQKAYEAGLFDRS